MGEEGVGGPFEVKPAVEPGSAAPDLAAPVGHQEVLDSLAAGQAGAARRAQDNLERRLRDEELVRRLSTQDFTGRLYEFFEAELARYAVSVLRAWMHSGYVFRLLAQRRVELHPTEAELRELHDDAETRQDLAAMTVAVALSKFRVNALRDGGWRVEGGANLTTYFMGACLFDFPNQFRKHRAYLQRHARAVAMEARVFDAGERRGADPADLALGEMHVRDALKRAPNGRTRAAVALTVDGYSQEEIAELTQSGSARAVEGIMYRWRLREKGEYAEGERDARTG